MAKIDRVSCELKMSKGVADDLWKSLTLGAEATVGPNETFGMASEELYHDLAVQLRFLWNQERKEDARQRKEEAQLPREEAQAVGDEAIEEPPVPEAPADPSWCSWHKAKMKLRSWGGYSHKAGEQWCQGHWCGEHDVPHKRFTGPEGGAWWSHSYEDPHTGEALWCREG